MKTSEALDQIEKNILDGWEPEQILAFFHSHEVTLTDAIEWNSLTCVEWIVLYNEFDYDQMVTCIRKARQVGWDDIYNTLKIAWAKKLGPSGLDDARREH